MLSKKIAKTKTIKLRQKSTKKLTKKINNSKGKKTKHIQPKHLDANKENCKNKDNQTSTKINEKTTQWLE